MMTNPLLAWLATFTRRWHTNADLAHTVDPLGGHGARVALLAFTLKPTLSRDALLTALVHDLGECKAGDLPSPTKAEHPAYRDMAYEIEAEVLNDILAGAISPVSDYERDLLDMCDKLDAWLWARHHAPHLMRRDDWMARSDELLSMATRLHLSFNIKQVMGENNEPN